MYNLLLMVLLAYPGEFSHCKDMSFAEDHLLVAFSKEIGDPSFGILISKTDGQNNKVICLRRTLGYEIFCQMASNFIFFIRYGIL